MSNELARVADSDLSLDPEEDLWLYRGKPFSGTAYETDVGGALISEQDFQNGAYHGVGRGWYPNGQLATERYFRGGLLFGLSRIWFENGQLKSEGTFEYGVRLRGQKWNERGDLIEDFTIDESSPEFRTLRVYRATYGEGGG